MVGTTRLVHRVMQASAGALMLLVAGASPARAQVDFGISGSPTIANLSGSYVDSSISTWGIAFVFYVEWHFAEHFSVEGGISPLSQKGAFEVESPLHDEAYDYRTTYFEIPIAINYRNAFFGDLWGYRIFAGGAPAFSTGCDVKPSTQFSFDTECSAETPGGELASSDFLIHVGFGVDRLFKGGSGLGFDARYTFGMKNQLSEAEAAGLTATNRVLELRFRLFLPLEGPRE
jgi:hypothetical protein